MNKAGPIILIEDDSNDSDIINHVYDSLHYEKELHIFNAGLQAFEYLKATGVKPFIIISDIYMNEVTGFELRAMIQGDENLRMKFIPFLFFTSGDAASQLVTTAYSMSIQGFFQKPSTYDEIRDLLTHIIEYWKRGMTPGRHKV
jgi:CheY-like chemotaxis protein